ncbi:MULTISPECIES: beta-ketoacyl synthase N-terminal-like domain-containing protein [unclassified Streptomyces]|uniref:beta-ketoacyl synthase N-terminal-like domain-containing protein n=1 Tax=unclassified Streptomyces TaxID=2593676 RepID=UPI000382588E|nr:MULTISPECIES: beta-ketoacyl synthase N-terminal-like domain-containing protein [unclassified Streptomyces]MYT29269.1 beta-ketoacyl synthase [Streptomyces sp. SID8354]
MDTGCAVTSAVLYLPEADAPGCRLPAGTGGGPAPRADRAHELLGRKGLSTKDAATRLALCAVHRALDRPDGGPRPTGPPDTRTAVVVSSGLGNVAAVTAIARSAREGGRRQVSPLQAPNASSNVIAATLAIRYRWGGPNLMVCSGATGGLDALETASLLLRTGRADRVVLVGAESGEQEAAYVLGGPLRAVAACVLLCRPADAPAAPRTGQVLTPGSLPLGGPGELVAGPPEAVSPTAHPLAEGLFGTGHGADGVLALAAAARQVRHDCRSALAVCGSAEAGWRACTVTPYGAGRKRLRVGQSAADRVEQRWTAPEVPS